MRATYRESHRPPGFVQAGLRKARVDYHAVAHVRAYTYTMRGLAACVAVSVMDGGRKPAKVTATGKKLQRQEEITVMELTHVHVL